VIPHSALRTPHSAFVKVLGAASRWGTVGTACAPVIGGRTRRGPRNHPG